MLFLEVISPKKVQIRREVGGILKTNFDVIFTQLSNN